MVESAQGERPRSERALSAPRALLLAAGSGSRLRPLTDTIPKCLVPVGGVALLDRWQAMLDAAGVGEVTVNAHAHADQVRRRVNSYRKRARARWRCDVEQTLLGTAGTVRRHLPVLERSSHFLILYADNYSCVDLAAFQRAHCSAGADFTIALFEPPDLTGCGVVQLDDEGIVVGFEEKPCSPRGRLANAGMYAVSAGVLGPLLRNGATDLARDVLPALVGRMRGWLVADYHRDIGTPPRLAAVERDIAAAATASVDRRSTRETKASEGRKQACALR